MMKSSTLLASCLSTLSILLLAPQADAHGYLSSFTVDGKTYPGDAPGTTASTPSPIRQISTIDPVKGSSNPNLLCGQNAQKAALVADVMPGSAISFLWTDGAGNWPHNTGPLMTYMASCGSTPCNQFDPTNAKWFKIAEAGKEPNNPSVWVQQDIANRLPYNTTIPSTLASGGYLIRHEIIALQLAVSLGGAEFYPSCTQVNVGGSQTGVPSANELVSFPGAYSDTDPGIYDPNVYNPGSNYTFPGPAVAQLAASGSGSGSSSTGSPTSSPSSTPNGNSSSASLPPSPSSSVPPGSSGSCSLSKRSLVKRSEVVNVPVHRPHHTSRIMRNLMHGNSWQI